MLLFNYRNKEERKKRFIIYFFIMMVALAITGYNLKTKNEKNEAKVEELDGGISSFDYLTSAKDLDGSPVIGNNVKTVKLATSDKKELYLAYGQKIN